MELLHMLFYGKNGSDKWLILDKTPVEGEEKLSIIV